MPRSRPANIITLIGPGILVAATGVGAGGLATAGFAGAELGLAVAWAVVVGATLKLVLTENLARHQLATGNTILESAVTNLGYALYIPFGIYLVAWSYFVGAALISANATALIALTEPKNPQHLYPYLGIAASLAGLTLALLGGFKLFERIMAACIALMVAVVIAAAIIAAPNPAEILKGLLIPSIPNPTTGGLAWTVALMGGVGGTLTILCYSYWMRDAGRTQRNQLKAARIDITIGYTVTAAFGLAMLAIAAPLQPQGSGLTLITNLARELGYTVNSKHGHIAGATAQTAFLIGALGAVFSSLLGVWQAVPYIFTDWLQSGKRINKPQTPAQPVSTTAKPYRLFLVALATIPLISLRFDFTQVQKIYAIVGAAFVPALALVLLIINNRPSITPTIHRNRTLSNAALIATLALTATLAILSRTL